MSRENVERQAKDPLVTMPHGEQQQMKIMLLDMIHRAEDPYSIIYHVALRLEKDSGEVGYARHIEEQIQAVYGLSLKHTQPLKDIIKEVKERLKRIEASYESDEFTPEEHERIGFAMVRHRKRIEELKELLEHAEAYNEPETLDPNPPEPDWH